MTNLKKTRILSLIPHGLPDFIYYPKLIKIKITHPTDPSFLPPPIQQNAFQNSLIINSILSFQNYHLTSTTPHTFLKKIDSLPKLLTVKTVHACPTELRSFLSNLRMSNAEVWKQLTKIRAKCSNIWTECSSKLTNFIQDLFWSVRFSNEDFKMAEDGLASLAIVKI